MVKMIPTTVWLDIKTKFKSYSNVICFFSFGQVCGNEQMNIQYLANVLLEVSI